MTKQQIRNLVKQITVLTSGDSEKMLDISLIDRDLEALAAILNQYNDRQRQTIAAAIRHEEYLKESVANISHDLRTPLTVMLGHLQLLQRTDLSPGQAQRIAIILNKAEKMKSLVSDFYELSILDADNMIPQKEKFNLSNLLLDLIAENAPTLENNGLCPDMDLPGYSVMLVSDCIMVERILQNLLINVVLYSTGTIKIRLSENANGKITFCIENPIPDNADLNTDKLFERFYTGDKSRNNESTGLGLAVVKILAEKLGGTVSAVLHQNILTVIFEI